MRSLRRSFNRGGNYNNTANGFASFNGNNDRSNANGNIGFRSALLTGHDVASLRAYLQHLFVGKGIWILGQTMSEVVWKKNYGSRKPLKLLDRRSGMG